MAICTVEESESVLLLVQESLIRKSCKKISWNPLPYQSLVDDATSIAVPKTTKEITKAVTVTCNPVAVEIAHRSRCCRILSSAASAIHKPLLHSLHAPPWLGHGWIKSYGLLQFASPFCSQMHHHSKKGKTGPGLQAHRFDCFLFVTYFY